MALQDWIAGQGKRIRGENDFFYSEKSLPNRVFKIIEERIYFLLD